MLRWTRLVPHEFLLKLELLGLEFQLSAGQGTVEKMSLDVGRVGWGGGRQLDGRDRRLVHHKLGQVEGCECGGG